MSDGPLYINFTWHMHQPYYKDLVTGEYLLPWVRLHAIKDYYDMAAILEDFPAIHQTFNMVPSLVDQIQDYVENDVKDIYTEYTLKPASDLTIEDKVFILHNFFMANWDTMVKAHPRYGELLAKRGYFVSVSELKNVARYFSQQDFLDLQVWYNLSWFDPIFMEKDPLVKGMIKKGRDFTEEDKALLIAKQIEIMGKVVPVYKKLAAKKQIEVSTTPYYHPILPLLCDTNAARVALPDIHLPHQRFRHPEDAREQIMRAVAYHEKMFGSKPVGMWPSEGSVSDEMIALVADAGIKWIATDEEILARTLNTRLERDTISMRQVDDRLYRPYRVTSKGRDLSIVFRDHHLSDLLGFVYSKWDSWNAVEDLIDRLKKIRRQLVHKPGNHLVSIILDGENAWEYYPNDGRDFFLRLYERLSQEQELKTVTVSEYLKENPPADTLPGIFTGSWINHNFRIWIGHEEDNAAWDLLSETRDVLEEASRNGLPKDVSAKAWEEIYIAEGSDWCWWYGDDHSSAHDDIFDELFRRHLMNVYTIIGREVPDKYKIPILREDKECEATIQLMAFINPVIDGEVSNYFEWLSAGYFDVATRGGAMHRVESIISHIYYGFNLSQMFFRIDTQVGLQDDSVHGLEFCVHFLMPHHYRVEIAINLKRGKHSVKAKLCEGKSETEWELVKPVTSVAANEIIELGLPFEDIKARPGEEVHFFVTVRRDKAELEKWPPRGYLSFTVPTEDFEAIMWQV
ncbi:MAG: glycoside hydrolase family 57 protein [Nitrospirota bacterium]|nr:glycoside hydrolase family 57 protein [Nitrospirota bacterium]